MPVPADPPARDHGARPAMPGRLPVAPPMADSRPPVLGAVLLAPATAGGRGASGDLASAVAPLGLVTLLVPTAPVSFTAPYATPAQPCS